MAATNVRPLRRERNIILGVLLALAAIAWGVLIWQSAMMGSAQGMGLTMGMSAALFLAIWVAMMVAMMFPTAAPMILMFRLVSARRRAQGQAFVPTWIFTSAYLLVWSLCGVLAYLLALGVEWLAGQSMWLMEHENLFSGGVLAVAGLYQLSPLKYRCLSKCRTPLQFILTSWRDGTGGAFRMGVEHGLYCLGCCWLLFVILFPLGMMNVALLALITLLIFAEKVLPRGRQISQVAGVALIAYGLVVIFWPAALPMAM
jgi:predicted metal-binding membrane protein